MRVCVYCASSEQCGRVYHDAAVRLGELLATDGCTIVYGGGAVGLMGSLANGALSKGGKVIGVIPRFMTEVEWQHPGLASLEVVEDMRAVTETRQQYDGIARAAPVEHFKASGRVNFYEPDLVRGRIVPGDDIRRSL